jgi:hypothetical protein
VRRALFVLVLTGATGCDGGSITGIVLDATPGDGGDRRGDGGPDDDATPGDPDAAPVTGLVTVHVAVAGAPVAGATVAFHTAGGTLLDVQETDAAGDTTGQVSDGGQVTTSLPLNGATLFTVTGVMPDEVVTIDPHVWSTGDAGTLAVSAANGSAGATLYLAETCATEQVLPDIQVPTEVALAAGCLDAGGTFDLLVRATTGGATTAYRQVLDATPDADLATDVVLPAPWRKNLDPAAVSITDAAGFATSATAGARAVRSGRSFHLGFDSGDVAAGEDVALEVPVPGSFAERVLVQAVLLGDEGVSMIWQEQAPPGALAVSGADFLLAPSAIDVDAGGTGLRVTWDDQAPAADLQAVFVGHDTIAGLRTWVVVVPPGAGSVSLPIDLPDAFDGPGLGDVVWTNVAAIETSVLDGYAQARTERPGIVLSATRGFVAGELDYTIAYAYWGITP